MKANTKQYSANSTPQEMLPISKLQDRQIVHFPHSVLSSSIRLAQISDLPHILELWANSATMRYLFDPIRWNWKGKASEIWHDYAIDLLEDKKRFLIICDFSDNGYSGFLMARIEELPHYYQAQYSLIIEEVYLRPKDKKAEILRQMIGLLLKEAHLRKQISSSARGISLKLESLESDQVFAELLLEIGFKKSSVCYTASVD